MLNITQKQWVEQKLNENGAITRNECLRNYISRLGALIAMLKKEGWEFETQYIDVKTPFGTGKDCQYKVIKNPTQKEVEMEKLENEEIYHLMDLLVMNTNNTVKIGIMSDEQKKESINCDTELIAKLQDMIIEEDNTTPNIFEQ